MNKREKNNSQLMNPNNMVKNMDILYHVIRKNEEEEKKATENMKELMRLMTEYNLDEVYFSPTELIINAVICYKGNLNNIDSEIDKKVCGIVCELGYM